MDQKTESPTPKKLNDARKKGQVVNSKEVVSASMLTALVFYFWITGDFYIQIMSDMALLPSQYYHLPFVDALKFVFDGLMSKVIILSVPLLFLLFVIGIMSNFFQIGALFVSEPIKPKMEKISVISGFKKIFSMKNFFEFIKSMIKIVFLSILVYLVIESNIKDLVKLPNCGKQCLLPLLGQMVLLLLLNSVVAFIIVAVVDYVFQKAQHIKELKMSKDEIKREYKETEGNPEIKSQRKSIHKELLNSDTRKKVSNSSVLITNPTHVAIGLYYQKGETPLPRLTIKGVDTVAFKIKRIAQEEGIPIIENIPLARALLAQVDVDQFVPDNLIDAVAEVFGWIERMQKEQ
ncbi:MAG: type III secretion protein U [Oceanicoccus sp.]|jgi:type III secretion protein U